MEELQCSSLLFGALERLSAVWGSQHELRSVTVLRLQHPRGDQPLFLTSKCLFVRDHGPEGRLTCVQRWVQKEARPISLRQLTFFGRTLTESRLISSANYVRKELPTRSVTSRLTLTSFHIITHDRLSHRLRDLQKLPYVVVTNPHISHVYELYYKAFEKLRRVREIKTMEDNDRYCTLISETLREHLTVIPRLAMGVLECQNLMRPEDMDNFMNTLLRSVRPVLECFR